MMNKERQTEIVYTETELRRMREDDLFQDKYWKDDEDFDNTFVQYQKSLSVKSYVYGTDSKMDYIVDELKRIKLEKEKRNERK